MAFLSGIAFGWLAAMGCASSTSSQLNFHLLAQAYNTIQHEYVDRSDAQPKELTYGALSGMVDALGDTGHSTFLTPEMVKELRSTERGEFKGVGIEIQPEDGHVVVVAPIDGSPAQRAGVQPGDVILKVAGEDVTDWPISKVVEHITGRPGTKVTLTLEDPHTSRTRQITLERTSIILHEVTWQKLPGTSVADLRLASFDAGATRDMKQALEQIEREKLTGIVMDLRSNPGGLLDEAVGVASQFLRGGNVLLAKDSQGKTSPVPVEKGGIATHIPLVVLINQGSASAAEIVAGALQDAHRAPLVGETTFGTGTVLQQFNLSDGSALLLAVEEWLTPNGRSFWHKGINPEYVVSLPPDATPLLPSAERHMTPEQLQQSGDRQMLTALRLLNEGKELNTVKR